MGRKIVLNTVFIVLALAARIRDENKQNRQKIFLSRIFSFLLNRRREKAKNAFFARSLPRRFEKGKIWAGFIFYSGFSRNLRRFLLRFAFVFSGTKT